LQFNHTGDVASLAYSPDGRRLASGGWDETIQICDAASGKILKRLADKGGPVNCVAFSPDGRLVASGSYVNSTVRVRDPESGRTLHLLSGHKEGVNAVAFDVKNSPTGRKSLHAVRIGSLLYRACLKNALLAAAD
jgi:WD40 repeat protein